MIVFEMFFSLYNDIDDQDEKDVENDDDDGVDEDDDDDDYDGGAIQKIHIKGGKLF